MDNMTLKVSRDGYLVIGADGIMETIGGTETTAQNIRMALKAWKGDFPIVPGHGTDYETVFHAGTDDSQIREAYREAIFQETDVAQINSLSIKRDGRTIDVSFEAMTGEGLKVEGSA